MSDEEYAAWLEANGDRLATAEDMRIIDDYYERKRKEALGN